MLGGQNQHEDRGGHWGPPKQGRVERSASPLPGEPSEQAKH